MKTKLLLVIFLSVLNYSFSQTNGWYQYHKPTQIFNLDVDASNNIHLATDSGYLKYNTTTNMVEDYANLTSQNPPIGRCYDVKVNPVNNNVALSFQGIQSMAIYDGTDYTIYNSGNSSYGDFTSASLHYTPSGMLYIFSKLDTKYQTFENGVFNPVQNISFRPEAIIENASGTKVYFAGRTPGGLADGLYELDIATDTFTNYTISNSDIHTNGVNCFFRDINDLLYVGGNQGISTLDTMGNWTTFQEPLPINPSLFYSVFSFSKFTDGTFLVNNSEPNSSLENGFSIFDPLTNNWIHYDSSVYCNNADQVQNIVLANDMVYTHFRAFSDPLSDYKLWSFDTSNNACEEHDINYLGIDDLGSFGVYSLAIKENASNTNALDIDFIKNGHTDLKRLTIPKAFTGNFPMTTDVVTSTTPLNFVYSVTTTNGKKTIVGDNDGVWLIDENNTSTHIPHNIPDFQPYQMYLAQNTGSPSGLINLIYKGFNAMSNRVVYKTQCNTTTNTCSALEQIFTTNRDITQDINVSAIMEAGNIRVAAVKKDVNNKVFLSEETWNETVNGMPQSVFDEDIDLLSGSSSVFPFWLDSDDDGILNTCFQEFAGNIIYCREEDPNTSNIIYKDYTVDFDNDGVNDDVPSTEIFEESNSSPRDITDEITNAVLFSGFEKKMSAYMLISLDASFRSTQNKAATPLQTQPVPGTTIENLPSDFYIIKTDIFTYSDTHYATVVNSTYGLLINTAIDYSSLTLSAPEVGSANDLLLYPNPATDMVSFSDKSIKTIEIFDINGRQVLSIKNTNTFSVKTLSEGIYIVKAKNTNNEIITKKLIKN